MNPPEHVYVIHIGAPAERVWQALTQSAFTQRYFHGTAVHCSWEPGAEFRMSMAGGAPAILGRVLQVDYPRRLSVTWSPQYDAEMAREAPSRVTYELEETRGITRLTVTHDQFAPESKVFLQIVEGWSEILSSLKSLLETGTPLGLAGNEARAA